MRTFTSAAWTKDGRGFFYTRFPEPRAGEKFTSLNLNAQVFYHRVGTPQAEDVLVYKRPDQPEWGFTEAVTEDGRYLVITTWKGTDDKYRVTYRDLAEPYALPVDLIDDFANEYSFVGNDGPVFYFKTDLHAPRRRLIAIDLRKPEPSAWKEILPQAGDSLRSVSMVGALLRSRPSRSAKISRNSGPSSSAISALTVGPSRSAEGGKDPRSVSRGSSLTICPRGPGGTSPGTTRWGKGSFAMGLARSAP